MEKLHSATRKLDMPTRTGIFCFSREGANTGSWATKSSTRKNAIELAAMIASDATTLGSNHLNTFKNLVMKEQYLYSRIILHCIVS